MRVADECVGASLRMAHLLVVAAMTASLFATRHHVQWRSHMLQCLARHVQNHFTNGIAGEAMAWNNPCDSLKFAEGKLTKTEHR